MIELGLLRRLYGSVYVTALPDGRYIPWKPLSVKDFLEFETLRTMGNYTLGQLEDDVFYKCVLDPLVVEQMDQLKAGTVSTVAATILAASSPGSMDELNYSLHVNRELIQGAIHQIVSMVCQAFSGYTPDDVYEMDYATLMQRAALAEDKLLKTGIIPERIFFEQQEISQPPARTELDSKQLYNRYEQQQRPVSKPPPKSKATVITTGDMLEAEVAYTGHERSDKILREAKMVDETTNIYGSYVEQMKKGEKVVIPSTEERKRAAQARARENEKKYKAALKSKSKVDDKEWQELLKIREKARARKARNAAK